MTKAKPPVINYETLKTELDEVMLELQREDLDVDAAFKHYKRGLELIQQIEQYLITAENKVVELKAKFNVPST